MSLNQEIEIKYTLENPEILIQKLNECAIYKGEYQQSDTYYNPPHLDFLKNPENISRWLRLRSQKGYSSINYKSFYPEESFPKTHCDEYETKVESVETLQAILNALDFKPLIVINKRRRSWDLDDVEISVDAIENLGTFVELEYKGSYQDVDKVLEYLTKTLFGLTNTVGTSVKYGYPHLMMLKDGWFK